VTKVAEEFFEALCSKTILGFEKHYKSNSFICSCTRHFALSNKKKSTLYDIALQSYIKSKINAKLLPHPLLKIRIPFWRQNDGCTENHYLRETNKKVVDADMDVRV